MTHEKVAPHDAGPDRRSTCSKNNNRSEQKWRRILRLLATGARVTRFDAEECGDHAFNSTVSALGRWGVCVSREAIVIEGRYGTIHCKRYWLEPDECERAWSLLGDTP
jgi:hypothetical protein